MQSSFRQIWSIELSATHSAGLERPPLAKQGAATVRPLARSIWPGLVLAGMVAATGFALQRIEGLSFLSPMILAVLAGIVFANLVGHGDNARAGIAFCQRSVLRFAVVLLGFQLTVGQIQSIGAAGIGVAAAGRPGLMSLALLVVLGACWGLYYPIFKFAVRSGLPYSGIILAITGGVALSINLTGGVFVNQSAAFSDFHGTGANPAANAALADAAFVANRFRVVQSRVHVEPKAAPVTAG